MAKKTIGHILDPRTGRPLKFDGSVSVWHESALVADILSTALYVMGPEEGFAWAQARGLSVCYLLESHGKVKVKATRAFNERFAYTTLSAISEASRSARLRS